MLLAGRTRRGAAWPILIAVLAVSAWQALPGTAAAAPADYPTAALADYVFGCMATNGQTQEALRRCACSIDEIAAQLPYEDYEKASTVLSLQTGPADQRALMFRSAPWAQAMVKKLREAQVQAETKCF